MQVNDKVNPKSAESGDTKPALEPTSSGDQASIEFKSVTYHHSWTWRSRSSSRATHTCLLEYLLLDELKKQKEKK